MKRAENYFAAGKYDQAKVEYSNLLRFDSRGALPYLRLGSIWTDEGAPLRAVPFLLKSRELAPNDLENRLRLARAFLTLSHRAEAFTEAMYVLEHSASNGEAARLAAEAAHNDEDLNRVAQAVEKIPDQRSAPVQLAIATVAIRKQDREGARKAVEQALAADPKYAPAHMFMATLWLLDKLPEKAGAEFKVAADLAPPRSGERLRYAQYQIQSGATDQALTTLTTITASAPDFLPAWLVQAELAFGRKDYNEATRLLTNIFNRDPTNIDASVLQGRIWLAKGDADKAVETLQRIDAQFPNFLPLKLELARAYVQKNNLPQAVSTLNQALKTNPDYVDAALLLGQINLRTGNARAAVDDLKPLVAKHPESTPARLLLADAYRGVGQLDDAANLFRDQLKSSPNNAEACLALGVVLRQQKKNTEAREVLEKARQLAPANPLPLMQLVDLDLGDRDYQKAQRRIEEQLQATPNSAMGYFLQGKVYAAQAKWDEAEASLKKALNLNHDFGAAYEVLASVYAASNKLPDAAAQLETVVKHSPNDIRALMSLATLYEKMGQYEKSRDAYERVLTLSPDFAPALNNLAFIYSEQLNQLDRAYQLADKARRLQPADAAIADTLGWVLFKKRDYQGALRLLGEAAEKSPGEPEIHYHVGMCRYMMGDAEAARVAFEQATNSTADFPHKADAQRRLALLSKTQAVSGIRLDELQQLVRDQPDDVIARSQLAKRYQQEHAFKDAAAQYEEVLKLNPRFAPAAASLAEIYSDSLNDQNKAVEYAQKAKDLSPGDPHLNVLIGRIAYKAANYPWAYGLLKQACESLPDDPIAWHALGWAAFGVGNTAEATTCMTRVVKIAPGTAEAEDAQTWLALMNVAAEPGSSGSEDKSADVLKKEPNYGPALLAQAAIATRNGERDRAIQLYNQLLGQFPNYAPAQKRLAALYVQKSDDNAKAYDIATKARKALPEDAELTRILADINYQRKDYSRALELLQEDARKEPLDANHLYYLGICSLKVKEPDKARAALNQALENGLQDPLATEAKRTLQQIK